MSTATNQIQRQDEFTKERRDYVGGSDLHHLFNLEPYGCFLQLQRKKLGQDPDIAFWGNSATERGTELEPFAAKKYAEKTGRILRKIGGKQHPTVPKFQPHPDYEIVSGARGVEWGPGLLSIKVPGREMFFKLKAAIHAYTSTEPAKTEFETQQREAGKKALLPYILQVQGEMAAFKRKWASFAIFWADGMQLEFFDINRDDATITAVEEAVSEFWVMTEGNKLAPKLDAGSKQCAHCEFRVSCQSDHLLKLLQKEGTDSNIPTIPVLDTLAEELIEREQIAEEAGELVDATKDKIRNVLTDADAGEGLLWRFYHKLQQGRQSVQRVPLLKFLEAIAHQAEVFLEAVAKGDLAVSGETLIFLNQVRDLDSDVAKKFVSTGAPFRQLRKYPKPKNSK